MVFTSGIVDEEPRRVPALLSTTCLFGAGVEPGVLGAGRGSDTLLGFEGSDSSLPPRTKGPVWVDGRGGLVVCELDSGREHLWQLFTVKFSWRAVTF